MVDKQSNNYKCLLCGSESYKEKAPYHSKSPEFLNKSIVECANCRLLTIHPMPTEKELEAYYASYWEKHDEKPTDMMPLFEKQAKTRYEFMQPCIPSNSVLNILDVGAGFGLIKGCFVTGLSGRQINYDAVEIEKSAIEYLHSYIKPRNIYSDLKESNEDYDIVILSHILEHLKNPLGFLIEQKAHMRQKGLLFIETPNQDYLYKSTNEPHLTFFAPATLRLLVERAGYNIQEIDTCGELLQELIDRSRFKYTKNEEMIKSSFLRRCIAKFHEMSAKKLRKTRLNLLSTYGPDRRSIRLIAVKSV